MIINKKFSIKIYDSDGSSFIKTLNPEIVRNVPSFRSQMNGGFGECRIDLGLDFDDFGEGTDIAFMNIVKIYEIDVDYPLGRLIYTGFISQYLPYVEGKKQGVVVILLGMVSLLKFAYYKNGSSYTVAHSGVDPSAIMKAIIDHFNTVYPGSLLGYDSGATTVDSVGVNVSYTFEEDKWLDALQNAFGTAGAGWWWSIDKQGQLYLKQKPSTATHTFTIGKDLEKMNITKSSESVVNSVLVKYGMATATNSDATSISDFGTREEILSDDRIQDSTTADQKAAQEVDDNKTEKIKASLTINLLYDIESIKVGDTCKIRNLAKGSTLFNDNMQIVSVSYSFDKVVLELEEINLAFGRQLDRFVRG